MKADIQLKNKIIKLILLLFMVVGMFHLVSITGYAAAATEVKVNGTVLAAGTTYNKDMINGLSDGTMLFTNNAGTATLTLTGANINASGANHGIEANGDLTIVLNGNNNVSGASGIEMPSNELKIVNGSGSGNNGSLRVSGDSGFFTGTGGVGINANVTILNGTLTAIGGSGGSSGGVGGVGINGNVTILNGKLVAFGGNGGNGGNGGISGGTGGIGGSGGAGIGGAVEQNGGTLTATGGNGGNGGTGGNGGNGGTGVISGGTGGSGGSGGSGGAGIGGAVKQIDGTLTATGGTGGTGGNGGNGGSLSVIGGKGGNGGNGGNAGNGIYNDISITIGTLTANGGNSGSGGTGGNGGTGDINTGADGRTGTGGNDGRAVSEDKKVNIGSDEISPTGKHYSVSVQDGNFYRIEYNLTNITSNGALSIAHTGSTPTANYTATLTATNGRFLPHAITVKVGSTTLDASGYTYTRSDGTLTIPQANITGNIEITAVAITGQEVKYSLTNINTNNNTKYLDVGNDGTATDDYTATLMATNGRFLPKTISVTVDSAPLDASNYTYTRSGDKKTATLTIPQGKITGNIEITAAAISEYNVTYDTTDISSTGAKTVPIGSDGNAAANYTTTLTATGGKFLPHTITVTVDGTALAVDTDYTYIRSTGTLTIFKAKITGDIEITATAIAGRKVEYSLTNISTDNNTEYLVVDKDDKVTANYTATLTATAAYLPSTITVTVGGTALVVGTDYTYKRTDGKLTIPKEKITGDIKITASASNDPVITIEVKRGNESDSPTTRDGKSLSDALGKSNFELNEITQLTIHSGDLSTADWNYLINLTALRFFNIENAVSVETMPDGKGGEPIFPATIQSVRLNKGDYISSNAFYQRTALLDVTVNEVTTIGDHAFDGCEHLLWVTAPKLTTVGNYAFRNCNDLGDIINSKITRIGDFAFYDCDRVNNDIFVDRTLEHVSGVTRGLAYLTHLGESAFARSTPNDAPMTEISMPLVESIGVNAFQNQANLTNIRLGETPPTTVGAGAFTGISADAAISPVSSTDTALDVTSYDAAVTAYKNANDGNTADDLFHNVPLKVRTDLIKYVDTSGNTHFIENKNLADSTLDFTKITELEILLGDFTTADWDKLKSVVSSAVYTKFVIHDEVTSVADMPDGTHFPTTIQNVTVHNLAKIGNEAFLQRENLEAVNFPDVTEVGVNAFTQTKLTGVTEANFPKLITAQQQAFASISTLTTVSLPNAKTLAQNAFLGSGSISTITLPKVTSLGARVFSSGSITTLELPGTPPTMGAEPFFYGSTNTVTITFITTDGRALIGNQLNDAVDEYTAATDGDTTDSLWYKCTIPAKVTPQSDADELAADKILMEAAINKITPTNTTTADEILTAANNAALQGTTAVWDAMSGFTLTPATGISAGSIKGTLTLSNGSESGTIVLDLTIAQLPTYDVAVTGGTADMTPVTQGTTVTITADTPPTGQRFTGWSVNSGGVILADASSVSTTFIMGTDNVTVTANFQPIPPTVTGVSVSPASVSVQKGQSQTFTASVQGTYNPAQTVTWTVEGNNNIGTTITAGQLTIATGETATTLTIRATSNVDNKVSGTATVTVTEIPVVYHTITPSAGANGSISPNTPQSISKNGSINFTFIPNSGFEVDTVTVDSSAVTPTTATSHTISNVQNDMTIHVTFKAAGTNTHNITLGANSTVQQGQNADFVSDGEHSNLHSVAVDGITLTKGTHYTDRSGSTVITLLASYTKTLTTGVHTLEIISTTGTATTQFTITDPSATTPLHQSSASTPFDPAIAPLTGVGG